MEFLLNFTSSKGMIVDEIIKDIGSGLNYNRKNETNSIVHVFSYRIYGLREYKKKIERGEEIAKSLQSGNKTNNKTDTED